MNKLGTLEVFHEKNEQSSEKAVLSNLIEKHFSNTRNKIKILEAGCGLSWKLDLRGLDYFLTGFDISDEALRKRYYEQKNIDIPFLVVSRGILHSGSTS